ncbi:MAG TPA: cation:proton antiporter [Chitinophagales bacterium]|nr:cation:proton antiporter [Chitinophagales bacterium]HMZ88609.1 cation:proton antiporter [Chitinophagales bacterium]HNA57355.1 cation:proton antiporter [Chitinophagales bacterium]HNE44684.1 cation:proton antiporter [Chitinophagales bacterium]HNI53265.1 cation:proton antiporter [Chitinophagales bacterium]
MHRLPSDEVLPFLLMVATLLLAARLMGELFRKLKLPQVMGELVAGILLGPSCLERCAPGFYESFFASPENAGVAYDGLARIGILLLLFVAGMEINLKTIQKKANAAAAISLSGVAFPFLIGFVASWYLSSYLFPQGMGDKLASSLFMGTALSITALSVLAKILIDIDKIKSKFGNLMMTAAMIDDFIGWMLFSLVVTVANLESESSFQGWQVMFMVIGFATFILTVGRRIIHWMFIFSNRYLSRGGGTLSVGIILCIFGAVFTEWLGLHAIFGAFLVGIAVGDSEHFSHKNREMLHDIVTYIFAPLFFVSIGFRVDFIKNFDGGVIAFVLLIAILGKMVGGYIGGRLGKFSHNESIAIGFGMNARGSQEIVLGLIALNANLITDQIFVALVVMTFVTIMIAGPSIRYFLQQHQEDDDEDEHNLTTAE